MKRFLLDTNIYGLIVTDLDREQLHENMHKHSKKYLIYGFSLIRNELREVPKRIKEYGRNLRIILLNSYDEIVKKEYKLTEQTKKLAGDYFELYRKLGGSIAKNKIINDFLIVACSTLHDLDIVVSEDRHSLLADRALEAYETVNKLKCLKMPHFISYEEFKNEIKK